MADCDNCLALQGLANLAYLKGSCFLARCSGCGRLVKQCSREHSLARPGWCPMGDTPIIAGAMRVRDYVDDVDLRQAETMRAGVPG